MANLVLQKDGEFWTVYDADRGVTIFSATNQAVAQAFINNGDDSVAARQRFAAQDIQSQGGLDSFAAPTSNPPNPQVPAPTTTAPPASSVATAPTTNRYTEIFNPETGQYDVVEINSGQTVASGLTEQSATLFAQDQAFADEGINPPGPAQPTAQTYSAPTAVKPGPFLGPAYDDEGNLLPGWTVDELNQPYFVGGDFVAPATAESAAASREAAARDRARQQQSISAQRRQINNGDWRVRLRLAPQAKYLYNSDAPGILQPLKITDGVIFPYTPTITTAYKATYNNYDLTHSNYRGYFYQNSYVDPIQVNATFTAQNTAEANYLLAVITFFKSVTKMFYGQDAERGAPPPLTYLTGLGEFQFNEHPCLVTQFNYTLPADVDYIRAGSPNQLATNQVNQRDRQNVSTGSLFGGLNRLAAALLTKGAIPNPPATPGLASNRPTYVPTKMEIILNLLPIQSRNQVSKQFSVKEFANGNLIKGGFW